MKTSPRRSRNIQKRGAAAQPIAKPRRKAFRLRENLAGFMLTAATGAKEAVLQLPDDLAVNHDYYLHGLPKQQPRIGRWILNRAAMKTMSPAKTKNFTEKLLAFAADIHGLPPDLAAHHDHYLHGTPKK